MSAARLPLPHAAIVGLAVSQFIGWGSTYYLPSILAPNFRADLGLSQEAVFGGTTIMLLVNAAAAPYAGRVIAKQGARAPMILGSFLMGLALVILSQAHGLWSYGVAWMVVGLAAPIALTQGAMSALAQIAGDGARRSISRVLLITGFTASVF
jgi:MFS family permease